VPMGAVCLQRPPLMLAALDGELDSLWRKED